MKNYCFASVAILSHSINIVNSFIDVLQAQIVLGENSTGKTNLLNERYARVGGQIDQTIGDAYLSRTSSWALECMHNHDFHFHPSDESCSLFSIRRVLFAFDKGCTLEIFSPFAESAQFVEKYFLNSPGLVEIEFDGRNAHRFRPLNDGRLLAYSFHPSDKNCALDAIVSQTIPFDGSIPDRVIHIELSGIY